MGKANAKVSAAEQDLTLFREAIQVYENLLQQEAKISSRATSELAWADFVALPADLRQSAIEQIVNYTGILAQASKERISLTEDKRLSWFAIKLLKLVPPGGLLDLVGETDYTEIYNADGIQIFRNLEFYKLFSYTIADMTLYTWEQLYNREKQIKGQIVEQGFVKGFSGQKDPYRLVIDDHDISEARSQEERQFHVSFGYLAPLRDQSQKVTAVFATSKITRLGHKTSKRGA